MRTLPLALLAIGMIVSACAEPPTVTSDVPREEVARWACPSGWVPFAVGGCGPAYELCRADGGGDPAACRAVESSGANLDGGASLRRLPDGAIGGAWSEPGEPGGPPAADWMPSGLPDAAQIRAQLDWACPEGWTRTPEGVCDPRLSSACPVGAAPLPGGRCTPTGMADCPSGDVPTLPSGATGRVIYVRPGTTVTPPTGERDAPFATLSRALETAPEGAWVLVGAGDLGESVRVTRAVHIVGLCAARTRLLAEGAEPVVHAVGGGVALDLRGVTLRAGVGGLWASEGATVEAERVVVERVARVGVRADGTGTRLTLRDAVVRDTRTETDGTYGYGLLARMGATLTAQRVGVFGNTAVGALAAMQSTLTLTDTSVTATHLPPDRADPSSGVRAQEGSSLALTRTAVVGNAGNGVVAHGQGARLVMTASYVADTMPPPDEQGMGVVAWEGARAELRQCGVVRSNGTGIRVDDAGARITLEDVTVRETRGMGGTTARGTGLRVSGDATVTGRRVRVEANAWIGILNEGATVDLTTGVSAFNRAEGAGANANGRLTLRQFLVEENLTSNLALATGHLHLHEVRIRSTAPARRPVRGLQLIGGALEGDHVVIEGSDELGVLVMSSATATLSDSLIRDTRIMPAAPSASGFHVQDGGTATLTRSVLEDNDVLALSARGAPTSARLEDCVIRRTRAVHELPPDRSGGRGVEAANGASVTLRRTLLADSADEAVLVNGEGSTMTLDRAAIVDTAARDDGLFGVGLYVGAGASATADGCVVARSHSAGVIVSGGALRFARGVVRDGRGADLNGALGQGVVAFRGAHVDLRDSLVTRNRESAVACVQQGTACTLTDVAITDTQPSRFLDVMQDGFGMGLVAHGAAVTARRVAVLRSSGTGILSARITDEPVGGALNVEDVFVATVAPQFIRYLAPYGDRVGYGMHVTPESSFTASRVVVGDTEFGFFQAGGTLALSTVVLHGNTTLAGAVAPGVSTAATRLDGVSSVRNSANEVRREVRSTEASLPLAFPCVEGMDCEPQPISRRSL